MPINYRLERLRSSEGPRLQPSEQAPANADSMIALDIQCKYQFFDQSARLFHEYNVPGNKDIHNCAGYVDKLFKYRDPGILRYLRDSGVSAESLRNSPFPILNTRSPLLDVVLVDLIEILRRERKEPVSLLDLGCTVGEHYDMLDIMLQARSSERAASVLRYIGLDNVPLVLSAAHLLHAHIPSDRFRLVQAEGSSFDVPDDSFDLSLTVGVVNHVADPLTALRKLVAATRYASVMAIWVTSEPSGFWVLNHSGVGNYFFSINDLLALQSVKEKGRFHVVDFVPETSASQPNSYIGIGPDRLQCLGCYSLVYSTLPDGMLPFDLLAF